MTTSLAAAGDGVQAIIDTAREGVQPIPLDLGKVYAVRGIDGATKTIDLTGDQYQAMPTGKVGTTTVWDVPAFLAYHGKHADASTEIYADVQQLAVTAVLDAHTAESPRWERHRLHLTLRQTAAWNAWIQRNTKYMEQEIFAEFLEDHLADLVSPPAAEMLEIAQSLQAASKVDFKSGVRLATGQRQLEYVETTVAKAGQKGTLKIPETFEIGLVPFEGSEPYRMTARFRYRINGGQLTLAYRLERPEDTLKAAFGDVVAAIAAEVEQPVLNGRPA